MINAIEIYAGPDACHQCLGWKRIANDTDAISWKYWAELRPPENIMVQLGLVHPLVCPHCQGSGKEPPPRRTVVCLCGSTRFYAAFQQANFDETMAGRIVLSVGFYPHSAALAHGESVGITPDEKAALDDLHCDKVRMADEILVLNVGGYIGESTARELALARQLGKRVRYLEEPQG